MVIRELWRLRLGKFLYLCIAIIIIYFIILWFIEDFFTKVILFFIGYSIVTVPTWIIGYYLIKKGFDEKQKFKHHNMFEFMFFLFLFCATFFLTFFVNYIGTEELVQLIIAGSSLMFFLVNAICAGLFHYSFGFHD